MNRKPKKCKACGELFDPYQSTQKVCSMQCAMKYAEEQREKKERKEIREAKQRLKTRSQWLKEAQAAFNAYIRKRDEQDPCISCGRQHEGQYHAGHYLSVGSTPELRFHRFNCHKQCSACNNYLSGNIAKYRIRLAEKIGRNGVQWLEGPHEPQKLTIEDIKEIKAYYKQQLKELEARRL